jgi:hypothetical protein
VTVNVACHFPLADGAAATTAAGRREIALAVKAATKVKPVAKPKAAAKSAPKAKRKA